MGRTPDICVKKLGRRGKPWEGLKNGHEGGLLTWQAMRGDTKHVRHGNTVAH